MRLEIKEFIFWSVIALTLYTCTDGHAHDLHFSDVTPISNSLTGKIFKATDGKTYNIYKGGDFSHQEMHLEELNYEEKDLNNRAKESGCKTSANK